MTLPCRRFYLGVLLAFGSEFERGLEKEACREEAAGGCFSMGFSVAF
jgi:hypothetical protein